MRFSLLIIGLLFFISCEDKKKTSEEKVLVPKETTVDTVQSFKNSQKEELDKSTDQYPKITQENVVEFLTSYGKEHPETKVKITTRIGDITLQLYEDTPLHRANFIYLCKQKYFENTFFHRIVPNFIIQGGNSDLKSTPKKRADIGKDYLLPAELSNGRIHTYGSVSGAKEYRENPDKKSAPFEFFIFLGPQTSTSHLNGNYTVFGKVIEGMDIVEKIANLPSDDGEWPKQNVYLSMEVLE